jgi:hypothetical protein
MDETVIGCDNEVNMGLEAFSATQDSMTRPSRQSTLPIARRAAWLASLPARQPAQPGELKAG